jgi:copper chaperone
MTSRTITVPNISCGHCVHTVEMEVGELAGVTNVKASVDDKQVLIEWQEPASWEQIESLLHDINYPPGEVQSGSNVQFLS